MAAPEVVAPPDDTRAAGRRVLIGVVGLHLIGETALTPFYPELFRALFATDDLAATGTYLWVCRVIGFAALPLWGLAARRWPLHRLVFAGLCASAIFDAALGLAPNLATFTAVSAAVVATNSALLLAYPALISTYDGGDRIRGVRAYVAVFHAAMVASTLVGAAVLALPDPRWGISAFALLDGALALLCYRLLTRTGAVRTDAEQAPVRRSATLGAVVTVAALAVVFEIAGSMIRPFFVDYAVTLGATTAIAALLFLLPHAAALAAMPWTRRAHRVLGGRLLPATFVTAAVGLAVQALATEPITLTVGRLIFGVGLGLGQVALDLRMFSATGTAGPVYTVVETARVGALFVAPIAAATAASHRLGLPIAVACVLYLAAALVVPCLGGRPPGRAAEFDTDRKIPSAS
ncbi:hypothetical protein [Nocardia arthritidis]|uniref:MFS transporter n=1 Tax=Nocardia arthritidis TaxID=228602 RepID=A0A6G9YLJ4_9NOCA|nr:hypothetical protein [Nocardia arthritidis]QIS14072.1 hypothetical protein F5544_31150 [Nocardia arthritidis]